MSTDIRGHEALHHHHHGWPEGKKKKKKRGKKDYYFFFKHTRNDELEKENTKRAQSRETVWPSGKAAGW